MARIYLDARAAASRASGVGRYAHGLVTELAAQGAQHEYIVIQSRAADALDVPGVRTIRVSGPIGSIGLLLSQKSVRRAFAQVGPADIYHALFHVLPYGMRSGPYAPQRVVVTLHDLIWIDYATMVERQSWRAWWRRTVGTAVIPYALRHADHVICNSTITEQGAGRWVDADRRSVVHMGVGPEFLAASASESGDMQLRSGDRPYITAFGVSKPYKNIVGVVRALAALRREYPFLTLTLIGGDGGVGEEITRLGLGDAVRVVRDASDDVVRTTIGRATAHVVPSHVEGFGLPVLEAMALGTPVVTSNAPALREVAGDAALSFDATDPAMLAAMLSRLLSNNDLRLELGRCGRARAAQFTWAATTARTVAVYERLLGRPVAEPGR